MAETIALLDVSRIFKNHARFKGMMEDMKADVERAENAGQGRTRRHQQARRTVAGVPQGNPRVSSRWKKSWPSGRPTWPCKVQLQKNEFLQREAKIYHNVYQEIWQATDYFCKQNGIDMVLRFNSEPVDVERPDSVLSLHQQAGGLVSDQSLDITRPILAGIESDGGQSRRRRHRTAAGSGRGSNCCNR